MKDANLLCAKSWNLPVSGHSDLQKLILVDLVQSWTSVLPSEKSDPRLPSEQPAAAMVAATAMAAAAAMAPAGAMAARARVCAVRVLLRLLLAP